MGQGDRHRVLPVKGRLAGGHLIHRNPQGVQIAPGVAVAAFGLLRGNVMHGSHGRGSDSLGGHGPGDPEISHFYLPVPGDQHILGLDIPVNNSCRMGSSNTITHLNGNAYHLFMGQSPFFLYIILQSNPVYQLHNDKVQIFLVHHVEHADNIRMRKPRRGLGLHLEFTDKIGILAEFLL